MNNTDGIEQQLEYISNSLESISGSIDEFRINYNNSDSSGGVGIILIIVLICINSNIKKLTKAIREKR